MNYRNLTPEEIRTLEANGCEAEDWARVHVSIDAAELDFRNVRFRRDVSIGKGCTLRNATIYYCILGNYVVISNVFSLGYYHIGDKCEICNCGRMGIFIFPDVSGHEVNVLDETGGRKVSICPGLSAQVAYMLAFYRHDKQLTQKVETLIDDVSHEQCRKRPYIGSGTELRNVGYLWDVFIGARCYIEGATELSSGTIGDGAKVLSGACASDFIIENGATLGVSCIMENSYLGRGARLDNGFIAKHSLIFSNCVLEGGEAVSLFAGPFTVSDHRNTLLIGAATSFFNAGSGTNHSNHAYRTGPVHHGVYERGCKTASNTHVVWPARVGQFSVVFGSHYAHPDTSRLPFSYLFGKDGKTTVVPAANLKTFGLMRDSHKWRERGKRDGKAEPLDCINYDGVTPYNVERMAQGIELLTSLQNGSLQADEQNFHVEPKHIPEGIRLYDMEIRYFFGYRLVWRIVNLPSEDLSIEALMHCETDVADIDKWVDMMGMLAPRAEVDSLCQRIVDGSVSDLETLNKEIKGIHGHYNKYCWQYVIANMKRLIGIDPQTTTATELQDFIHEWKGIVQVLRTLRLADAQKDFCGSARVGFGIDHPELADADFLNVRGSVDDDSYVQDVRDYYARDEQRAQKAIEILSLLTR